MSGVGCTTTQVTLTGEHTARALEIAQRNAERYDNDGDLGRDDDEWMNSLFLGAKAEVVVETYFTDRGFDAQVVDDSQAQEHDAVVEGLTVEVKLRKLWNYRHPDLLLRYDEEPSADIYVMVEAERAPDGHTFEVTKWASQETVAVCMTDFREDRPRVPRGELRDIDTLGPILKLFWGD